jgi:hypothetical protein
VEALELNPLVPKILELDDFTCRCSLASHASFIYTYHCRRAACTDYQLLVLFDKKKKLLVLCWFSVHALLLVHGAELHFLFFSAEFDRSDAFSNCMNFEQNLAVFCLDGINDVSVGHRQI